MPSNVYIVKSGSLVDFTGWEWLNLRAFTDYDKAEAFMKMVQNQIPLKNLGETEDVEIEELTLE
jgi:uncharacterized membrane protein